MSAFSRSHPYLYVKPPVAMINGRSSAPAPTTAPNTNPSACPGPDKNNKLTVACVACRKKKVKCSNDRPACSHCLRHDIPCVYPLIKNRGSRFGYNEMLNRRLASLQRFTSAIHHHHHKLQEDINSASDDFERKTKNPPDTIIAVKDDIAYVDPSPLVKIVPRATVSNSSPSAPSHSSYSGMIANINSLPLAYRCPSINTPPEELNITSHARSYNCSSSNRSDVDISPELVEHLAELYFKYVHNHTYSFLHKPSFMNQLRAGKVSPVLIYALCGLCARFSKHPELAKHRLVHEPDNNKCENDPAPHSTGEAFVMEARRLVSDEFDEPTLETVQAMILLVQYDFFRLQGSKVMIYIGLVIRMAFTMGLNKEVAAGGTYPPHSPESITSSKSSISSSSTASSEELTWVQREIRRRTWWSLTILDRLTHAGPDWVFQITAADSMVRLPCDDEAFLQADIEAINLDHTIHIPPFFSQANLIIPGTDHHMNINCFHIRILHLWGEITKYANGNYHADPIVPWDFGSKFLLFDQALRNIYSQLPPLCMYSRQNLLLMNSRGSAGVFIHFHTVLQLSSCILHKVLYPFDSNEFRMSQPHNTRNSEVSVTDGSERDSCGNAESNDTKSSVSTPPPEMITNAGQAVSAAAAALSNIMADVYHTEDLILAPFVGFAIFLTSIVNIVNCFSSDLELAQIAKRNLAINLRVLVGIREYWFIVSSWCQNLKDRYAAKAATELRKAGSTDKANNKHGVQVYDVIQAKEVKANSSNISTIDKEVLPVLSLASSLSVSLDDTNRRKFFFNDSSHASSWLNRIENAASQDKFQQLSEDGIYSYQGDSHRQIQYQQNYQNEQHHSQPLLNEEKPHTSQYQSQQFRYQQQLERLQQYNLISNQYPFSYSQVSSPSTGLRFESMTEKLLDNEDFLFDFNSTFSASDLPSLAESHNHHIEDSIISPGQFSSTSATILTASSTINTALSTHQDKNDATFSPLTADDFVTPATNLISITSPSPEPRSLSTIFVSESGPHALKSNEDQATRSAKNETNWLLKSPTDTTLLSKSFSASQFIGYNLGSNTKLSSLGLSFDDACPNNEDNDNDNDIDPHEINGED
ncbi:hypothetical protein NADFUDRAFT_44790 [Nadsonia fulvescens var. elongata DSM 6958]|uniref:Zn(2)-C6 fungal-type domain-containing protein n=1 Tax=Nadsonia fulvescens var. elongata DSM 6958 TaxID=857566 RepID=A0A1E3PTK7_9ASCO|nr:hypothetical protein NADFUDRAFT_44790 [Nadsonia fulvescens var. elongata DSM 6958]